MCASSWTLDELDAAIASHKRAIAAAKSGKSFVLDGVSKTAHDLPALWESLRNLERERDRLTGGAGLVLVRGTSL